MWHQVVGESERILFATMPVATFSRQRDKKSLFVLMSKFCILGNSHWLYITDRAEKKNIISFYEATIVTAEISQWRLQTFASSAGYRKITFVFFHIF